MDDQIKRRPDRLILFAEGALSDLANIDNVTAAMWGEVQAERYLGFLRELFATLAEKPSLAATIEERPELLIFTARYRKRRTSHGHRIIFREIDNGIEIIRILHTAMYWPNYIP